MKVSELVEMLTTARNAYYNGNPIMTDAEFDNLEDVLRTLDPANSFFKKVGAAVPVDGNWPKVRHTVAMSSLNKAQTGDELSDWFAGIDTDGGVLLSEKLDGISISLKYNLGNLVQAVTRGDGEIGEDITRNVLLMRVPTKLPRPFSGFVRGEIVCERSVHRRFFQGESNPRNTASGTAKRQDNPENCKHLTVKAYKILSDKDDVFVCLTRSEEMTLLASLGFDVPVWHRYNADCFSSVVNQYNKYVASERENTDYDIDGLVVEVNDLSVATSLGELNNRPKGGIAFKFPPDIKTTVLQNIVWQTGDSGHVTPVAEFEPVSLSGANVSRASLHNVAIIRTLWANFGQLPGKGDQIVVCRRNDVIPQINSVIATANGPKFEIPTHCPVCDSELAMNGKFLVCTNTDVCPAQKAGAIATWLDRVGILDWGKTIIATICDAGMVNDPSDLYSLTYSKLANLQLSGRCVGSAAETLLKNLHAKKEMPLHTFLGALGIPLCSVSTGRNIAAKCPTLADARRLSVSDAIDALGTIKGHTFVNGMSEKSGMIDRLLAAGITIKDVSTGRLKGVVACMTGFRNAAMSESIESQGGIVKTSVTKDLTHLIMAKLDSTSGKAQKAKSIGAKLVDAATMQAIVDGNVDPWNC